MFRIGEAQYLRFKYEYGAGEAYYHKRKPEQEPEPKMKFMVDTFDVIHRQVLSVFTFS